jgi:hypothetical protein
MHLGAIFCAVCFVIMFFYMEETIYFRDSAVEGEEVVTVKKDTTREKDIDEQSTKAEAATTASSPISPRRTPQYLDINAGWNRYPLFKTLLGRPSNSNMIRMAYRPVIMIFRFPTVAWAGFLYGMNLAWYNVLNDTASPILSASPYNWSAAFSGLCLHRTHYRCCLCISMVW